MTDLIKNDETEINLDDWLNAAKRPTRTVTVYGRGDLLADVDVLLKAQETEDAIPEVDRSAAEGSASKRLQSKIDALMVEMDKSKLVLRVSSVNDEEQEEIRAKVELELRDDLDGIAKKARDDAWQQCKRAGIESPTEKNSVVRNAAMIAVKHAVDREANARVISAAVSPAMSVKQVHALCKAIGDAQVGLISRAYTLASLETPQVHVPKSQQPSPSDDGGMSS